MCGQCQVGPDWIRPDQVRLDQTGQVRAETSRAPKTASGNGHGIPRASEAGRQKEEIKLGPRKKQNRSRRTAVGNNSQRWQLQHHTNKQAAGIWQYRGQKLIRCFGLMASRWSINRWPVQGGEEGESTPRRIRNVRSRIRVANAKTRMRAGVATRAA